MNSFGSILYLCVGELMPVGTAWCIKKKHQRNWNSAPNLNKQIKFGVIVQKNELQNIFDDYSCVVIQTWRIIIFPYKVCQDRQHGQVHSKNFGLEHSNWQSEHDWERTVHKKGEAHCHHFWSSLDWHIVEKHPQCQEPMPWSSHHVGVTLDNCPAVWLVSNTLCISFKN